MDCALTERRAHARAEDPWTRTARITLRPGHRIAIVNISRGGALVEGTRPMRPGTRVLLQIETSRAALGLSAVVVRCGVRAVTAEGVVYRGALKFDDRRDWTRELGAFRR
jgi:hypothetical protein